MWGKGRAFHSLWGNILTATFNSYLCHFSVEKDEKRQIRLRVASMETGSTNYLSTHMFLKSNFAWQWSLKWKCHFDEIFLTGCTESCHYDNLWCCQCWKCHPNNNICVSVVMDMNCVCDDRWIKQVTYNRDFLIAHYIGGSPLDISTMQYWIGLRDPKMQSKKTWYNIHHCSDGVPEYKTRFAPRKDTRYLASGEDLGGKWPRNNGTALYHFVLASSTANHQHPRNCPISQLVFP